MSPEQWDAWWDEQMYEFRLYLDGIQKEYSKKYYFVSKDGIFEVQNPVDALLQEMNITVRDRNG